MHLVMVAYSSYRAKTVTCILHESYLLPSPKEVMYSLVLVCLFVCQCLSVC